MYKVPEADIDEIEVKKKIEPDLLLDVWDEVRGIKFVPNHKTNKQCKHKFKIGLCTQGCK
jgi:hypothetical protein